MNDNAKECLARAESMVRWREHMLDDSSLPDNKKFHAKSEKQSLEYLIEKTKLQLDQEGVDYTGYEQLIRNPRLQTSRP